jgi:hypothetical protein
MWRAACIATVAIPLALTAPAAACTFILLYPTVVPTDSGKVGSDHSPPTLVSVDYTLDRPADEYLDVYGCGLPASLTLHIQGDDDQTPPEALRYRSEGVGGADAHWFDYPDPVDALWFHLVEEAGREEREPLEARIRVWAIDEAGNESEPMDVRVVEDGASGCGLAPVARVAPASARPDSGVYAVALGMLLLLGRKLAATRAGD